MLSISKTYFYLFCFILLSLLLSPALFKMADELCLLLFGLLGGLDMLYNRAWKKYKLFFVLFGVMLFYLLYSMATSPYNSKAAMVSDFLVQLKPLVAFSVTYAIAPKFTNKQKSIVKILCFALATVSFLLILPSPYSPLYRNTLFHVYYQGILCAGCGIAFLLMSYDKHSPKGFRQKDLLAAIAIFAMGLACTRAKYYGFFVLVLYLLFIYRPGTVNLKSVRNIVILTVAVCGVFLVAWNKINYYFLSASIDILDPDTAEAYARPALYAGAFLIFTDHLFLGSGLASFATFSSSTSVQYSQLYYQYGLDNIWGLSPKMDSFITDTFYPELAQFGLVGICFFLFFCHWIWKRLRIVLRCRSAHLFVIGAMSLGFLAIDATSSCTILQSGGEFLMAVLGIIVASVKAIPKNQHREILSEDIHTAISNRTNKEKRYEYEY